MIGANDGSRTHLRLSRKGGKCEAYLLSGREVKGILTNVGTHAFGVRLQDGSTTAIRHRDIDYVVTELSL